MAIGESDGAQPGGHATIHAARVERATQTHMPLLRRGHGDRAPAHRTSGIQRCCSGATRCATRGTDDLSSQHQYHHRSANMPTGMAAALVLKIAIYRHLHSAALAMRVGLATKAVGVTQCALPAPQ